MKVIKMGDFHKLLNRHLNPQDSKNGTSKRSIDLRVNGSYLKAKIQGSGYKTKVDFSNKAGTIKVRGKKVGRYNQQNDHDVLKINPLGVIRDLLFENLSKLKTISVKRFAEILADKVRPFKDWSFAVIETIYGPILVQGNPPQKTDRKNYHFKIYDPEDIKHFDDIGKPDGQFVKVECPKAPTKLVANLKRLLHTESPFDD